MGSARVGSNPTGVVKYFIFYIFFICGQIYIQCGGLAQLVERVVRNDEAPGSKPGFSKTKYLFFIYFAHILYAGQWSSGMIHASGA